MARLRAPLCIALVGRVSSGKSTLLNALLGTAVSPTDGRECTKVVYVFRSGRYTTASVVSRAGSAQTPVFFDGSRLPSELGIPVSEIRFVDVTLPAPLLNLATLVDTPGLASTNTENSAVTERMLRDTTDSAAEADALLFCVNGPIKEDEADAVKVFCTGGGARRLTGGTAVGILTRADQVDTDPRSSWKSATELARTMSTAHADLFSIVVPVIGLLAETAATGALREWHARALGALAAAWNPDIVRDALASKAMFLEEPGPVPRSEREELLRVLGQYGVGELIEQIWGGIRPDAASLTRVAQAASGIDDMTRQVRISLGSRADVLKADGALRALMDHAYAAGDRGIYDAAQTMLDRPEMFPLRVIDMAQQLATGAVTPPPGLVEQAWITVQTGLPRASRADAARAARAWREWALLTDSVGQRIARVMVRAWQLTITEESR